MSKKPTRADLEKEIEALKAKLSEQRRTHDQDIAQTKKAEEALRESEEKFKTVTEQSPNMIFINKDGRIVYCNQKCEDIMGYTVEHMCSPDFDFLDIIAPESRGLVIDNFKKHSMGDEIDPYEYKIIDKQDNQINAIITTKLIQYEGERAILGIVTDITDKKRLEDQLHRAQKMEALGTLAGGIAHDFNNLLMGIQGNASLMLLYKDPGHPEFEKLKNIEEHVESGADLTKQLLGFARRGKYEVRPTDLNALIKKSAEMFGRTKKEISLHMSLQENLWAAEVDQGQIQQVLFNLYVNSWQAMPGGGDLYLETGNFTLKKNSKKMMDLTPGKYIKIVITDTGIGMDHSTLDKIFDPFFTTKERGRGTGLGLASAYGIIKTHGGLIAADSVKGKGASLEIYIPASEKTVVIEKVQIDRLERGSETILVIDDEKPILDISRELLENLGYQVLTAQGGNEALEILKNQKTKIHLVLLDIIMPEMGGEETFDRIKQIDPNIKILLSSGYSINGLASEMISRGCNGFVQKPFNLKEISQKLKELLND